jgi:hypothetical protein
MTAPDASMARAANHGPAGFTGRVVSKPAYGEEPTACRRSPLSPERISQRAMPVAPFQLA